MCACLLKIRDVIARLVDGSEFAEFKRSMAQRWSPASRTFMVTGGYSGNNGVLMSESAGKGAQFIQLCNQQDIPLLFCKTSLVSWWAAAMKKRASSAYGAKLIMRFRTPPCRPSQLWWADRMRGKLCHVRTRLRSAFLFTWPNHRIAVMGEKTAFRRDGHYKREAAAKTGQPIDEARW